MSRKPNNESQNFLASTHLFEPAANASPFINFPAAWVRFQLTGKILKKLPLINHKKWKNKWSKKWLLRLS